MEQLEFRVLGPVEARRRGRPAPLGGKALSALAGLLLSANNFVTFDTIADWVWGDELPEHPRAALHNMLFRVRRQLGHDVIETLAGGYRLVTDEEHLDVLKFRQQLAAASSSAAHGADEDAANMLGEALRLWRQPLLGNVDSPALLRDVLGQLTELRLNAYELRAQICLRLGWHAAVIEDLSEIVRANPFREPLAGLLMLAQLRSGRRADALATYDCVRNALREELGIDPGAVLQDLYVQILKGPPQPGSRRTGLRAAWQRT